MSEEQANQDRLLVTLGDATVASAWAAVVMWIVTLISWVSLVAARSTLVAWIAQLAGVNVDVMAVIWLCTVALLKLTAISFAAMAVGLWVWQRRIARRLAKG